MYTHEWITQPCGPVLAAKYNYKEQRMQAMYNYLHKGQDELKINNGDEASHKQTQDQTL